MYTCSYTPHWHWQLVTVERTVQVVTHETVQLSKYVCTLFSRQHHTAVSPPLLAGILNSLFSKVSSTGLCTVNTYINSIPWLKLHSKYTTNYERVRYNQTLLCARTWDSVYNSADSHHGDHCGWVFWWWSALAGCSGCRQSSLHPSQWQADLWEPVITHSVNLYLIQYAETHTQRYVEYLTLNSTG